MLTRCSGDPSSALGSTTSTVPSWVRSMKKKSSAENRPRQPEPHVAVANVAASSPPSSPRIRIETVASNTSAVPEIVTGLATSAPEAGVRTTIAGFVAPVGSADGDVVTLGDELGERVGGESDATTSSVGEPQPNAASARQTATNRNGRVTAR
jgi:hypothetical protein